MDMAGSSLAYQAEHKPAPGQAPDELGFLTQIWMNHSNNTDRQNNGAFGALPQSRPNGLSLPSSPAASAAIPPQNTLSASDAILNAGQLRKEPPGRAAGAQFQSGDALLQAFSDLPQQHSLKVNTALLGTANGSRASLDSQRAQSPFWLRPPSQGPVMSQVNVAASCCTVYSHSLHIRCVCSWLTPCNMLIVFLFSGTTVGHQCSSYINRGVSGTAAIYQLERCF